MSSKRNRRGHRLIRRLTQSHLDSGKPIESFIFWSYRNDGMRMSHRRAMMLVQADHLFKINFTATPDPTNFNAVFGKFGINPEQEKPLDQNR